MKTSRLLGVIAISAGTVSIGCFAGAYALATANDSGSDEIVTREIPWDGSRTVSLGVEADLHYVQSAGPATLVARGPQRSLSTLVVSGGHVQDGLLHTGARLELTLRAPQVSGFVVNGKSRLVIESFDQPQLSVAAEGRASVEAAGRAGEITLALQGRTRVNLARLDAARVGGSVAGNATVVVAADLSSRIDVRGGGAVVLLKRPAEQANRTFEAGSVIDASN
jgi:hypothetical protein